MLDLINMSKIVVFKRCFFKKGKQVRIGTHIDKSVRGKIYSFDFEHNPNKIHCFQQIIL